MQTDRIVSLIDRQIAQLQQARTALQGIGDTAQPYGKRSGRPKGAAKETTETTAPASKRAANSSKRTMSAEAKARIAAAQKKRWAAQKLAQEPATRKYAAKPKPAKKKAAPAKKNAAPEMPPPAEMKLAEG